MTLSVGAFRTVLVLLAGLMLSGCLPSNPQDEEKEPYFLAGKSRVNSMDYKGAIEAFEKAVEVNPRSAAAHFELALLYDQKESDPAAAIYHYERYLALAPNSGKEDMVKPRILACKQQLAQSVTLAPVSEKQQRELERLLEENKRLREDIQKWQAYASYLQTLTNQAPNPLPAARVAQPARGSPQPLADSTSTGRSTATPAASPRTHTVKAGETPTFIARKYGVKLEALMAANPRLDPRRMQIGQAVIIPSP